MSEPHSRTRAEWLRDVLGTTNLQYRVTVTGTRRHTGKVVPLRRFKWDGFSWCVDLDDLYMRLGETGSPDAVRKVLSAVQSQQHGRPSVGGTAWRIGETDVPIAVLYTVLDAVRQAGGHSVGIDDVTTVVDDMRSIENQANSSISALRQIVLPGFPGYTEQQHARKLVLSEILKRCSTIQ